MITLRLDKKMEALIDRLAAERDMTRSDFVRESIAHYMDMLDVADAYTLGNDLFGRHASGRGNLAQDRKAILKEKLKAKHQ